MIEEDQKTEDEVESSDVLEHEVKLDELPTDSNIIELSQKGNYLSGITDKGTKFRQRIPNGKVLNKVKGKFVLENMIIRDIA